MVLATRSPSSQSLKNNYIPILIHAVDEEEEAPQNRVQVHEVELEDEERGAKAAESEYGEDKINDSNRQHHEGAATAPDVQIMRQPECSHDVDDVEVAAASTALLPLRGCEGPGAILPHDQQNRKTPKKPRAAGVRFLKQLGRLVLLMFTRAHATNFVRAVSCAGSQTAVLTGGPGNAAQAAAGAPAAVPSAASLQQHAATTTPVQLDSRGPSLAIDAGAVAAAAGMNIPRGTPGAISRSSMSTSGSTSPVLQRVTSPSLPVVQYLQPGFGGGKPMVGRGTTQHGSAPALASHPTQAAQSGHAQQRTASTGQLHQPQQQQFSNGLQPSVIRMMSSNS